MAVRISIDVGGTFTDVVVSDNGRLYVGKALTTPGRIWHGIEEALGVVTGHAGGDVRQLLERAGVFLYGTTAATNAILEERTARTAFLVTEGFPDILVLREGGKKNAFDFRVVFPRPYIPRRLTFEIRERLSAEGDVVTPFDERQALDVLQTISELHVEAIGVCFLWSIINPVHEEKMAALIERHLPELPYTISHRINPIMREYRRASSAAIDASLKPLMQLHLKELAADLSSAGFGGELLAATSAGGVIHVEDLLERPIYAVRSGPSLAPVAAAHYSEMDFDERDVISCDTGGTSFDVGIVRDGRIKSTRETWLGGEFVGHLTGLSSVDVRSIGAGGGSVAWIDPGGLLRVGPQSAGSDPGPACYGRGGSQPTVTDAAVVLGYIDPEYFLGGRMRLDTTAAREVMETLGVKLSLGLYEVAHASLVVANEQMVRAIQEITINEGVDPRESLIVAGGGAAGLNIVPIARELGCREVLVPRSAGALSASGAQYSDIVVEHTVSRATSSASFAFDEINDVLSSIQRRHRNFGEQLRERGLPGYTIEYVVEARYVHQVWELEIAFEKGSFEGPKDVDALVKAFHESHERIFAVKEPGQEIEFLQWKGRLRAPLFSSCSIESHSLPTAATDPHPEVRRTMYFPEVGLIATPIVLGDSLGDRVIAGPAVIEEPTTTIVVYPQSSVRATKGGNFLLTLDD